MNRMIHFANGCEVRCPYHASTVDIIGVKGCLPITTSRLRCQYLSMIHMAKVICLWIEADGHAEK